MDGNRRLERFHRQWGLCFPEYHDKSGHSKARRSLIWTASIRYPFSVHVFYGVSLLFLFLQYYSLLVLVLLALYPTVQILTCNIVMKEDLLKVLSLIFDDQAVMDEAEKD